MDDPRMPALLVSHHRPGFHLRVLTEGAVEAGQEIVKLVSGPEGLTVAETDALLYLPGHPRQQVLRALRIPALSPGWKASFQEMLGQPGETAGNAGLAEASPPPAWPGFRPLVVTGIGHETDTVISVRLADPGGGSVPAALPGQFVTLRLHPDPGRPPVLRSYSLSGPPGTREYRISVKREEHGIGSPFVHTRVRASDLHALADARSSRDIWWLHGARRRADEPCRCAGRAAPASATPARPPSCPGRSAMTRLRSTTPPTAAC
jgi:hypothetical protein